jgi:toxin ParE1/3/4
MSSHDLRIRVSRRAQAEIKRIYAYTLAHWDIEQADRYQQQIANAFNELARFPFIGTERPDIARGIRSWVVGTHVVLYRVGEVELIVTRVVHSRQDPGAPKM